MVQIKWLQNLLFKNSTIKITYSTSISLRKWISRLLQDDKILPIWSLPGGQAAPSSGNSRLIGIKLVQNVSKCFSLQNLFNLFLPFSILKANISIASVGRRGGGGVWGEKLDYLITSSSNVLSLYTLIKTSQLTSLVRNIGIEVNILKSSI